MRRTKLIAAASAALAAVLVAALALWPLGSAAGGEKPAPQPELKTLSSKASYALGLEIGRDLRRIHADVDLAAYTRGFEDGFGRKAAQLTGEQRRKAKQEFFKKVQAAIPAKNLKEGQAFLAANKKKKGVVTTRSGLQYLVLKKGGGELAKPTDRVKVHYRGTLLDGTVFDSSYKKGPATFSLGGGLIKGWKEGIPLMKVGAKYRFFIPGDLAYGPRGRRGSPIGPNALLIFEVELLGIE